MSDDPRDGLHFSSKVAGWTADGEITWQYDIDILSRRVWTVIEMGQDSAEALRYLHALS